MGAEPLRRPRESRGGEFLQQLNTLTHVEAPGTITVAEESTSWPGVSRPVHLGGLGFTYKWNMGWMHDTLKFTARDPVHRRWARTRSRSRCSTRSPRTSSCRTRTTRSFTASGRCSTRCRATLAEGRGRCGRSTRSCSRIPARSCCSWATSSASGASGTARRASTGSARPAFPHDGLQRSCAISITLRREPALYELDFDPRASDGSTAAITKTALSPFIAPAPTPTLVVCVVNWTPVVRDGYRVGVPEAGTGAWSSTPTMQR